MSQKITPFLWFDDQAEEAASFYTSIFENSRILETSHYSEGGPGTPGAVMTVSFELEGQQYIALNGGPHFTFNEAVSFVINCETQDEVDRYWNVLTDGGEEGPCGWLKDRFGLSWQVVPRRLQELVGNRDPEIASRATVAMLQMKKIDIAALERAVETGEIPSASPATA